MKAKQGFGQGNAQRLGLAAVLGCILVPIFFLVLVKSTSNQFTSFNLQLSIRTYGPLSTREDEDSIQQTSSIGTNLTRVPFQLRVVQQRNDSIIGTDNEPIKLTLFSDEKTSANSSSAETGVTEVKFDPNEKKDGNKSDISIEITEQPLDVKEEQGANNTAIDNIIPEMNNVSSDQKQENNNAANSFNFTDKSSIVSDNTKFFPDNNEKLAENKPIDKKQDEAAVSSSNNALQESKLVCDLSEPRTDTCTLLGDIRVLPKTSTIILASASDNSTIKIRPYARKWESPVMQMIKEVTISPSSDSEHSPSCSVKHNVPAVIFSTGGFLGNFFHDFTDVLVPLFVTSRQFQGEVQFLVTDFNAKWISKYRPILKQLSHYEIISMDTQTQVHCFPQAQVGLLSHKVLGIDPSKTPNGYSMVDFKQFLRSCFNLNKESVNVIPKKSKKKPRLLMILRKGSRSLMNTKEVVAMARSVGFKVITAGPEVTRDLARFARIVNSCDVMMGVHGAGLANMVFLPTNASLVQIIPLGGLKWACWHDFGEPAPDMGLNYVEYEIKEEESSLIQEYPRDHAVFKDPLSIHRQGWNQLWSIFLDKQKVKLDVSRFRVVLLEIYQSLKR